MTPNQKLASIRAGAAATAAGIGASVGFAAVEIAGFGAAGMIGGGAGIGCSAGPVGATFGALAGLSLFGLAVVVKSVYDASTPDDVGPLADGVQ
ncbi:MAG: hypothetical protein JWM76_678 [Pseudonocardiales bacterium]|nr:hypothetical protein [Pseudonocardiales bacterium]